MIDLSHKPTIKGCKVALRPFHFKKDFPAIAKCLKDPVVLKYTGSDDTFEEEKSKDWYQTRNSQTDRLDLAVIDKETGMLVGEVVLNLYDEQTHSMNFRILIGPDGRNRGLGTEASKLLLDYAFRETDLHAITLSVFAFNPRAIHVYESLGFTVTSVDKDDLEHQGDWIDSLNMTLKRSQWKRI
ncbi:GNAT family N-acetyltransferase [Salimicrobium halophilum]|uniref:Diamine N-acetyltransferase n=1 Tax=Salimicrobium halophilum TaxID=86666 RepID=A0A1G8RHM2_9BACI|nr:GNAT family protein [Salimicrobium halophilum]SDJ16497.1 diamine N-acetyltransferase [Salimicrobium halophilum]